MVILKLSRHTYDPSGPFWFSVLFIWLTIEVFIVLAYIVSNALYLSVRFFFHAEMYFQEPSLKVHSKTDFVDAHYANTNLAGASTAPAIISLLETMLNSLKYGKAEEDPGYKIFLQIVYI